MSVGKLLFVVCILIPLCYAGSKTIQYNGLAVTLIPHSPYPTLGLACRHINDPNQQWILPTTPNGSISSANPNYGNYVWDVSDNSVKEGTRVILFPKKQENYENQEWTVSANGVFASALAAGFTAAQNGSSNLFMTYFTPATQFTILDPITQPWQCSSVGDPHITPYPGGRNDLYSPGAQQPGTFTLSKTGAPGDPDFLQIQADQQQCQASAPGIYCNKRGILKTLGHVIEVTSDTVTIDSVVTPVTGTLPLGNGLNVTKLGTGNYVVSYPNGQTQFQTLPSVYKYFYMNIFVSVTAGCEPNGGLCTPISGPNPTTKRALTPYDFCLSWRAPNITDDLFNYTSYPVWRAANPLSFNSSNGNCSSKNQTLIVHAYSYCAPIASNGSLAAQCAGFVPTAPVKAVYQACLDDVICTGDYSFSAAIIDGFSKRCTANAGSGYTIVLPTSGANSVATGAGLASNIDQSTTPVSFTITAKDVNGKTVTTGGDNFVVTISGGISFTQTYLGAGVYQISYTPSVAGTYTIAVQLNGFAPVVNSPFTVNVASTQTVPAKSTASGPGLAIYPASVPSATFVSFTVVARTASGAQRKTGGDNVTFSVSGSALLPKPSVVDNHDGTYTATYMQNLAAAYFKVTVSINGGAISGSPFTVYVNGDK
eukprot:Phypoly_transcript_04987.p1 GENE.Phypoly_transcript_04987~~Phypoly_transcript_04987.p1  ORF type:complete len:652 (-),score=88.56 Phypoly_transcript_04987:12-1967(-)